MERPTNSDTSSVATLLMLNNDCLDEIFKLLALNDRMSLAETCCRLEAVSGWSFKKYKDIVFDRQLMEKRHDYMHSFII